MFASARSSGVGGSLVALVPLVILGVLLLLMVWGCGQGKSPYRTYSEELLSTNTSTAAQQAGTGINTGGSLMAQIQLPARYADIGEQMTWALPPTWVAEEGGSGVRFATFRARDTDVALVVVGFPGDVGSLQANVERWLRQMQVVPPRLLLTHYLTNLAIATNSTGIPYIWVDLTQFATKRSDDAIVVVILRFSDYSIFFKMQDQRYKLEAEQQNFAAFIASLRLPAG